MSEDNDINSTLETDTGDISGNTETGPVIDENNNIEEQTCKSCGSPSVVEGYSIPLCKECRKKYTNYPVPTGIKIFSAIVIAILIFSLVSFPKSLNAGIAYERGQRAENLKMYATAAKEYKKVVDIFPSSFIASGKLFIAYAKNQQFDKADKAFSLIENKQSSDSDEIRIIDQANDAMTILESFYNVNQELINIIQTKESTSIAAFTRKLKDYTTKNPTDFFGFYYLANLLFDQEMYEDSKIAYLKAVSINPDINMLRLGAAAAYRQTGEFDKAIEECNTVLNENKESADAYVSLSKIHLKQHQYKQAMESAIVACNIDNENYNSLVALVLAYHFNGMTAERDAKLADLKIADDTYYDYAIKIINGDSKLFD